MDNLQGVKFLVVDDQPVMRKVIGKLLKDMGLQNIAEADDGDTALTLLRQGGFGFIVTDIHMPRLDGLTLLRRIRANPDTKHLPVLIVSTATEVTFLARAAKYGASGYITKDTLAVSFQKKVVSIWAATTQKDVHQTT